MCCHGILSLGLTILDGWEKGGVYPRIGYVTGPHWYVYLPGGHIYMSIHLPTYGRCFFVIMLTLLRSFRPTRKYYYVICYS